MEIIIDATENAQGVTQQPPGHFSIIDKINNVWNKNSLLLAPNISLALGTNESAKETNKFINLSASFSEDKRSDMTMSQKEIKEFDIYLSLWPETNRIIPVQINKTGISVEAELEGEVKNGERCFIINESASKFISISNRIIEKNRIRVEQPKAIESWLSSCDMLFESKDRYVVSRTGHGFEIKDNKNQRKYSGWLKGKNDDLILENELYSIRRSLESKGLGAILPIYNLGIN
jgi:hypothetical protein